MLESETDSLCLFSFGLGAHARDDQKRSYNFFSLTVFGSYNFSLIEFKKTKDRMELSSKNCHCLSRLRESGEEGRSENSLLIFKLVDLLPI